MAIKSMTCWYLETDCCNKILELDGFEDTYVPHDRTEADILALIAVDMDDPRYDSSRDDYESTEHFDATVVDGKVMCWKCLTPTICAERGHRWNDWITCLCTDNPTGSGPPVPARIAAHRITGCTQHRECQRPYCHAREERPVPADAAMPEPCQPIGCDNGYHLTGCVYAGIDV